VAGNIVPEDRNFAVYMTTVSNELEMHKLCLELPVHQLGERFKEVLASGEDDYF
jgi:hypothetical protein